MKKINVLLSVLLVFAMLFANTAVFAVEVNYENVRAKRVAFVGDSITYGAGVSDRENEAYASIIQKKLGDEYIVGNFGVSATSALSTAKQPYTEKPQYQESLDFYADILFIMFGTNDIKYENWDEGKEYFIDDYVALIDSYIEVNPELEVYIGIPPRIFKENVFGERSPQILENEGIPAIYEVAEVTGATVIDLFTPTKDSPELFPDFLHPDAEGNKVFANIIYDAMFNDATDIANGASDWAKNEIELAYKEGIMPESLSADYLKDITRQEFCEMVVNMLPKDISVIRTASFDDCQNDAVNYAYSVGVVNGMSDTTFAPDNKATRQEMATMLYRAFLLINPDVSLNGEYNIADIDMIADWALQAVKFLNINQIMMGDQNGNVMPEKNTSVQEAVLLVYRTYLAAQNYEK